MDKSEFIEIARRMRALQIEFFETERKDRRPNLVMLAKRAEKAFDDALDALEGKQLTLFGGD